MMKNTFSIEKYKGILHSLNNTIDNKINNYMMSMSLHKSKIVEPNKLIDATINNNNMYVLKIRNMINEMLFRKTNKLNDYKRKIQIKSYQPTVPSFGLYDKNNNAIGSYNEFMNSGIGGRGNKKLKIKFLSGESVNIDIKSISFENE